MVIYILPCVATFTLCCFLCLFSPHSRHGFQPLAGYSYEIQITHPDASMNVVSAEWYRICIVHVEHEWKKIRNTHIQVWAWACFIRSSPSHSQAHSLLNVSYYIAVYVFGKSSPMNTWECACVELSASCSSVSTTLHVIYLYIPRTCRCWYWVINVGHCWWICKTLRAQRVFNMARQALQNNNLNFIEKPHF